MRWEYEYLNTTPYLYSSKGLRSMYSDSRGKKEKESIMKHIQRHQADHEDYPGYYRLMNDIEEDIGIGGEEMDWSDFVNDYDIVKTRRGIEFRKRKGNR